MIIYGPYTDLIFTLGGGTHVATLDPDTQTFLMTQLHVDIPEGKAEFAINASNA
jgi:fructose-1,6-bisphosphatase I